MIAVINSILLNEVQNYEISSKRKAFYIKDLRFFYGLGKKNPIFDLKIGF
jgi:hypothetical protein